MRRRLLPHGVHDIGLQAPPLPGAAGSVVLRFVQRLEGQPVRGPVRVARRQHPPGLHERLADRRFLFDTVAQRAFGVKIEDDGQSRRQRRIHRLIQLGQTRPGIGGAALSIRIPAQPRRVEGNAHVVEADPPNRGQIRHGDGLPALILQPVAQVDAPAQGGKFLAGGHAVKQRQQQRQKWTKPAFNA